MTTLLFFNKTMLITKVTQIFTIQNIVKVVLSLKWYTVVA